MDTLDAGYKEGWVLDPTYRSNPVTLNNVIIYHMVKYSEMESGAMLIAMDQKKPGPFDDVIDVKDVPSDEVAGLVEAGWVMYKDYAKLIRMLLRKKKEIKHALVIPLKSINIKNGKKAKEVNPNGSEQKEKQ